MDSFYKWVTNYKQYLVLLTKKLEQIMSIIISKREHNVIDYRINVGLFLCHDYMIKHVSTSCNVLLFAMNIIFLQELNIEYNK